MREVTDEVGRKVQIPVTIHRVISLAPSITETLYALGLQDRLIADSDYCDYPPEAKQKPHVGGTISPSIEMIASLHPDVVLTGYVALDETPADVAGVLAEVEAVRSEGLTLPLTSNEVEPVFALGFALDQLRQNFIDLRRCVQDYARGARRKKLA